VRGGGKRRWTQADVDAIMAKRLPGCETSSAAAGVDLTPPSPQSRRGQAGGRAQGGRGMNALEAAYDELLRGRLLLREIAGYSYQGVKFRLADRCWYTPDFLVITLDGRAEAHETKGFLEDDAAVKLRVMREAWPGIALVIVRREGGEWEFERR